MAENATPLPTSPTDATVQRALEVAKSSGRDEFTIRITHRPPGTMQEDLLASFLDATADQIAHPEAWLPLLGGGGQYRMRVYHVNERAQNLGADILHVLTGARVILTPQQIYALVSAPDWQGPRVIEYPKLSKGSNGFRSGTSTEDPLLRIGGLAQPADPQTSTGSGASQTSRAPVEVTSPAVLALSEQVRALQTKLHERDAEAREERHRAELAAERERAKLELERLRSEVKESVPKSDPNAGLAQILLEMNKERAAADERRLAEQRAADERREAAQRRDDERREADRRAFEERTAADRKASDERFNLLLTKMLEKPKEDPVAASMAKMMAEMAASTSAVVSSTVQMSLGAIHSIRELTQPQDDEPGWVKGLNAIVQGFAAMQAAGAAQVAAPAQGGAGQQGPMIPTPVIPPPPQAVPPTPRAPATVPVAGGFAEAPESEGSEPFAAVLRAIMQKHEPRALAAYFLDHVTDPSIQRPLAAANNDIVAMFRARLAPWLAQDPRNQAYAMELLKTLGELHKERMAAAQAQGEEEEDEGDEEGDESGVDSLE